MVVNCPFKTRMKSLETKIVFNVEFNVIKPKIAEAQFVMTTLSFRISSVTFSRLLQMFGIEV